MRAVLDSQTSQERERIVLEYIVQNFVLTASPIGSRTISKHIPLQLSAATIRNIMSDLEDQGLITQPHSSAGRIPTDKGYRYYVDSLMQTEHLSTDEKQIINSVIDTKTISDYDQIFRESSKILAKISHQIAIVSAPQLSGASLQRVELISLSSTRVMVVISVSSGFVKTMMFEVETVIQQEYLHQLESLLNERLCGLTLQQIRESISDRMQDAQHEKSGLVRLFIVASDKLFTQRIEADKVHIDGVQSVVEQPEFGKLHTLRSIIELIEDEKVIVHILESRDRDSEVMITIGEEHADSKLQDFSFITSQYYFGPVHGTVGVIGPKRMNYAKLVSIVDYIAKMISQKYAA